MRTACLGFAVAVAVVVAAAACGGAGGGGSGSSAGGGTIKASPVKTGGSITVLESSGYSGAWPAGLDPATNVDGPADQDFMEAIYGQLFMLGPNGKILPGLATGYSISPDAKTVTITLRHGVTFTDGTPFNAQAVVWNWERELGPVSLKAGIPLPWVLPRANPENPASPLAPGALQAKGPYTVVVHQSAPDSAFVDQLFDSIAM